MKVESKNSPCQVELQGGSKQISVNENYSKDPNVIDLHVPPGLETTTNQHVCYRKDFEPCEADEMRDSKKSLVHPNLLHQVLRKWEKRDGTLHARCRLLTQQELHLLA